MCRGFGLSAATWLVLEVLEDLVGGSVTFVACEVYTGSSLLVDGDIWVRFVRV